MTPGLGGHTACTCKYEMNYVLYIFHTESFSDAFNTGRFHIIWNRRIVSGPPSVQGPGLQPRLPIRITQPLQFWIMNGIFYIWDGSIVQYQTVWKSCVNWALFINRSSTNTLEKLCCCPRKTNCIHCLRNAGFFGKLNKVIFPSQPKTHFFRYILLKRVPCSSIAEWKCWWPALLQSMRAWARSSGRNAHIRSSTVVYVSKSHDRKKTRKLDFWHRNTVMHPNSFLKLCPCLAWESNSLTV